MQRGVEHAHRLDATIGNTHIISNQLSISLAPSAEFVYANKHTKSQF
jgi:hypothetical protein